MSLQRGKTGAIAKNHVLVNLWKLTYTRTSDARPYGLRNKTGRADAITIIADLNANRPSGEELEVEIDRVFCVLFDERLARLDLLAHEHGEYLVGLDRVLDAYAAQRARLGIHRRLPQLVRVHLAEALEAGYIDLHVGIIPCLLYTSDAADEL